MFGAVSTPVKSALPSALSHFSVNRIHFAEECSSLNWRIVGKSDPHFRTMRWSRERCHSVAGCATKA
jgi:hypothetical protein